MKIADLFITDQEEYVEIDSLINKIFIKGNEFPKQVFQSNYSRYHFAEFGWGYRERYWEVFQKLVKKSNDDYIVMAVLDNDLINYYKSFGIYFCGKLPITLSYEEFGEFLFFEQSKIYCDSMTFGPEEVVCFSPSLKWAIYGHQGLETSVLAFEDHFEITDLCEILKPWGTLDDAIEIWIPMIFAHSNFIIPQEIIGPLRENYSK